MNQIKFDDLEFKKEWQYDNPVNGCFFHNGIIAGKMFYSEVGGEVEFCDAQQAVKILEKVFADAKFSGKSYGRIVDYSKVKKGTYSARKIFADKLKQLNDQYNCNNF